MKNKFNFGSIVTINNEFMVGLTGVVVKVWPRLDDSNNYDVYVRERSRVIGFHENEISHYNFDFVREDIAQEPQFIDVSDDEEALAFDSFVAGFVCAGGDVLDANAQGEQFVNCRKSI